MIEQRLSFFQPFNRDRLMFMGIDAELAREVAPTEAHSIMGLRISPCGFVFEILDFLESTRGFRDFSILLKERAKRIDLIFRSVSIVLQRLQSSWQEMGIVEADLTWNCSCGMKGRIFINPFIEGNGSMAIPV